MLSTTEDLKNNLLKMDKKSYRMLKGIQGSYSAGSGVRLHVDYVQGDPFAAPSRIRITIPLDGTDLNFDELNQPQRIRTVKHFFSKEFNRKKAGADINLGGTGKSGMIFIDAPGPEVIERSSVHIDKKNIEFRLSCGIPASGRKILGNKAAELLCELLPDLALKTLESYSRNKLDQALETADDQKLLRKKITENHLTSFIADGAVLPRKSGNSSLPLREKHTIPFKSPETWRCSFEVSRGKIISGMGIPRGVTLIIGGGYHGKSTLLKAVERGVYDHEPGDGREYVVTEKTAVKIRAEDGRSIREVNISPFINELPFQKDTSKFTSPDASGSTSQAANIIEALETGCRTLLIDEDTSATNFMIRDARMQYLVKKEKEPITPFIDRIRELYDQHGVSTVLVLGGSGDYFDAADHVIMMDEYVPFDRTKDAKEVAEKFKTIRRQEKQGGIPPLTNRIFPKSYITKKMDKKGKIQSRGLHQITIGKEPVNLHAVEQLVSTSQTEALAMMLKNISVNNENESTMQIIDRLYKEIEKNGLDSISPFYGKHPGNIALPRPYELAAALNRIRP
ncbi:ABC-ATPase domain-containing protein [Alkalicoccus saliphilus]|uniref:ATPase n=1 Tax=Alkalicoccus saliphilus TaxID=200989 RepID=A0A2T4UA87_9BACI|nr:ABC-ATPase domain-containing protein [Alkalicoccus saliphilus]PTL40300.1 ATPase [Alkalicoccus saliphilus]